MRSKELLQKNSQVYEKTEWNQWQCVRNQDSLALRQSLKQRKLTVSEKCSVTYNVAHAPVAQLDRVLGYEPRGRAFESLRAHQIVC